MAAKGNLGARFHSEAAAPRECAGNISRWSWLALALAYVTAVTAPVIVETYAHCHLYTDLGLYTDGILGLNGQHLNPLLHARRLHLFNDHFDPIVWLAVPWVHLWPPYGGIIFEAVTFCWATVPLYLGCRAGYLPQRVGLWLAAMTLFSAGAVTAAHFPIHPTTWAVAPWVWLGMALARQHWRLCFAAFVCLLCCREEFPFVGPPLALVLWRCRQPRWAASVLAVSFLWLAAVYGVRPVLLGPVAAYARQPFVGLFSDPYEFWVQRFIADDLCERVILFAIPFLPAAVWLIHHGAVRGGGRYALLCLPPMALRVLGMSWRYHYHAVTVAGFALALMPGLRQVPPPRWLLALTFVLLVLVNFDALRDTAGWAHSGLAPNRPYCPLQRNRLASIWRGTTILRAHSGEPAFVGNNLHPHLAGQPNLFILNGAEPRPKAPVAWVFFEKPPLGVAWPSSDRQVEQHIAAWRTVPGAHVLIDDAYVFVAQGQFGQCRSIRGQSKMNCSGSSGMP